LNPTLSFLSKFNATHLSKITVDLQNTSTNNMQITSLNYIQKVHCQWNSFSSDFRCFKITSFAQHFVTSPAAQMHRHSVCLTFSVGMKTIEILHKFNKYS